jgi:hypothetical protein
VMVLGTRAPPRGLGTSCTGLRCQVRTTAKSLPWGFRTCVAVVGASPPVAHSSTADSRDFPAGPGPQPSRRGRMCAASTGATCEHLLWA